VFGSRRQRGRLATDHPEDSKKSDYTDGDSEKIKVFSIHKAARFVAPQVSCLKSRI
jgi:hypothetical protein